MPLYLKIDEAIKGPYSIGQLITMLEKNEISVRTPACSQSGVWISVGDIIRGELQKKYNLNDFANKVELLERKREPIFYLCSSIGIISLIVALPFIFHFNVYIFFVSLIAAATHCTMWLIIGYIAEKNIKNHKLLHILVNKDLE